MEDGEEIGEGEVAGDVVDVSSVGDITAAISAQSSVYEFKILLERKN